MQIRAFFDNKGPFNNYVDKVRGEGVQKITVFVYAEEVGQKMAKKFPRT